MNLCDKALAATSEAMVITDAAQRDNPIIYANASFYRLLGAPALQGPPPVCSCRHMRPVGSRQEPCASCRMPASLRRLLACRPTLSSLDCCLCLGAPRYATPEGPPCPCPACSELT